MIRNDKVCGMYSEGDINKGDWKTKLVGCCWTESGCVSRTPVGPRVSTVESRRPHILSLHKGRGHAKLKQCLTRKTKGAWRMLISHSLCFTWWRLLRPSAGVCFEEGKSTCCYYYDFEEENYELFRKKRRKECYEFERFGSYYHYQ